MKLQVLNFSSEINQLNTKLCFKDADLQNCRNQLGQRISEIEILKKAERDHQSKILQIVEEKDLAITVREKAEAKLSSIEKQETNLKKKVIMFIFKMYLFYLVKTPN